jgi:hypothetical protein
MKVYSIYLIQKCDYIQECDGIFSKNRTNLLYLNWSLIGVKLLSTSLWAIELNIDKNENIFFISFGATLITSLGCIFLVIETMLFASFGQVAYEMIP